MCGICGIFEYKGNEQVDARFLSSMLDVIHHRGPDDFGVHLDKGLALGMRRLSIIDLEGGRQPIYNEDQSVVVLFNGEIYNYVELREELRKRGHRFRTQSDTEVIAHLYEEKGINCVDDLRGMFAFALWDRNAQRLYVVRDRLGIKPLYYSVKGGRLLFGSEIKAILQHPSVKPECNLEGLGHYLTLKYVPSPHTMFSGILSLPPGHLLICDENSVKVHKYWDLSFAEDYHDNVYTEEEYTERLSVLVDESVRLRLRSDVPFGAFLSGGVDSSLVVAQMNKHLDQPVKTFSIGYRGKDNELPYAHKVAEHLQTDHHELITTAADFIDQAEKVIWHMDQPIADQATVATYMLSTFARQHVKMVLTGEGGDELFAGYARYSGERLSPLFNRIPNTMKSAALKMSNLLPGMRRPKIALYALCQADESRRLTNWFPLFNQDAKDALQIASLQQTSRAQPTDMLVDQQLRHTNAKDAINRMLYLDTKLWLPDFLLLRGDKLTMAASLEGRVPLLDHKLVEFAATLPPKLKVNRATHKYLLKKASADLLPDAIIHRKKDGFSIPIDEWFRGEARQFLRDLLMPDTIRRRGLFDAAVVEKLFAQHESNFADHSNLLWGLASVEIWMRKFVDNSVVPHTTVNRQKPSTIRTPVPRIA